MIYLPSLRPSDGWRGAWPQPTPCPTASSSSGDDAQGRGSSTVSPLPITPLALSELPDSIVVPPPTPGAGVKQTVFETDEWLDGL